MTDQQRLTASQEDYLETIYNIIVEKGIVRSKEIARRMQVSRSSVTDAFRALAKRDLINYTPYEIITLTAKGRVVAKDVIRRHRALKEFFIKVLSVDEEIAEAGACRIEHAAPREIIERIIHFVSFIEECPEDGREWIKIFADFCRQQE